MARPLRLEFKGAVYHLTSRGNARQKVFFSDTDRELFFETLAQVVSRYGWICHAYCLMANHYHLLVETPKANLSLGMRQLRAGVKGWGQVLQCDKCADTREAWRDPFAWSLQEQCII